MNGKQGNYEYETGDHLYTIWKAKDLKHHPEIHLKENCFQKNVNYHLH